MTVPFQRLLDAHADAVLRYLTASLGPHDADDAFQETFLSAIRAWNGRIADPRAWLLTIAHRKAVDAHRRRARHPLPVAHLDDRPAPEAADAGGEHWARVRSLPPRQHAVLTLRYAADLSHAEIAAVLGCSEEAARRAASDGLRRLREELDHAPVAT